jgi:TolB-like protein
MPDGFNALTAPAKSPDAYAFGRFLLRARERVLLEEGVPVELGTRALDVLFELLASRGQLLTKEALLDRVWPGVIVEENNLQVQISALRRALGPFRDWIATVPGRGYRFTAPVTILADEAAVAHAAYAAAEAPALSVLVLPFAGRGEGTAPGWFADALTDSITTDLARALPRSGAVAAQVTADTYRLHAADAREIGRSQRVRYVVEGSVLVVSATVRVNLQLICADTGAHLWADRFDLPCAGDVLALQDVIAGRIVRSVAPRIINADADRAERAERERPGGGTAEDYTLLGWSAFCGGAPLPEHFDRAHEYFTRALARDPEHADALAGIGMLFVKSVLEGVPIGDAAARDAKLAEADELFQRALKLAPGHYLALKGRLGLLRARGAFDDAIIAGQAMLARNPAEVFIHRELGLNLLHLNRAEEALDWFRRADAFGASEPMRWIWLQGEGRALLELGCDIEAVEALRLSIAGNPTFAATHALLAAALAMAGQDDAARDAIAVFRRAEPDAALEYVAQPTPLAPARGHPPGSRRVLEGLRRAEALSGA